jgi:hypothetical protein
MEDAPAGIPGLCIDHLADLIVSKLVGNSSNVKSWPSATAAARRLRVGDESRARRRRIISRTL